MKKILENLKKKGQRTTILGVIIMVLGGIVAYMGQDTANEAEKGLMMLDNAKLGESRLK